MKKKLIERKIQLIIFFFLGTSFLFLYFYIQGGQSFLDSCDESCDFNLREGFLRPLYFGTKWLSLIIFFLIFVSPDVFKKWLFYLASPMILLTIFLVSNISIYSDGVIKLSRTDMSQLGMQGLAIVTTVFLLIEKYLHKRRP